MSQEKHAMIRQLNIDEWLYICENTWSFFITIACVCLTLLFEMKPAKVGTNERTFFNEHQ